ncbi:MAG: ABC transporter ATP-binding protein [Candidatus Omnitrophota bacterium]|nr:ABC transporter ATP-binding protein [Candidatus Omnitrophota bacterium]
MPDKLKKILTLLNLGESKKLFWLLGAIIFMGLLDMVGVASIFPFLSVISNPGLIQSSSKLRYLYQHFHFQNQEVFLVALGIASFLLLFIGNIVHALTNMSIVRFTATKRYIISRQLLSQYLYEPYAFFLNRNSAELTSYLMSDVSHVVTGVLNPFMQIIGRSISAFLILVVLCMVNPWVVLWVMGGAGLGYSAIYMFARNKLFMVGQIHSVHSKKMYKVLNESFGGIKDIKLMAKEGSFLSRFLNPSREIINCLCWRALIETFPRYAFETIVFGSILIVMCFSVIKGQAPQALIPIVGLYALAALRLMPALQQIYQETAYIRTNLPALDVVYKDFVDCTGWKIASTQAAGKALPLIDRITLRQVSFQYFKAQDPVLSGFNLEIKANTIVGLVGGSGAGKTTVVDIILGLLRPGQGDLLVDGQKIGEDNLRHWQAGIGYVPQQIYLCDDTVARNIAFGVSDDRIDHQLIRHAAELANIHDFIMNELPQGYETEVGERGVRLSGGQRQRIGIARALYHDPTLLVFDEATSALDGITEDIVLEAINNFAHKKTIILIAHRLSTVRGADVIYMLEQGRVVAQGTYEQLLKDNETFGKMAKVTLRKNG